MTTGLAKIVPSTVGLAVAAWIALSVVGCTMGRSGVVLMSDGDGGVDDPFGVLDDEPDDGEDGDLSSGAWWDTAEADPDDPTPDGAGGGASTSGAGGGGGGGGGGDGSGSGMGFAAPTADLCERLRNAAHVIRGTDGHDVLRGTDHRDIIFGGAGNDIIWGNGGNDVICAGGGEDIVHGGAGADYIDGGFGNDTINGGAGNDTIHGRNGGDRIHGGANNDRIFGDVLDDKLFGDSGHDLLIGGHGTDELHGGGGADWLRGDMVVDLFDGGNGRDTASFATATPPGQPLAAGEPVRVNGVSVNLNRHIASGDGFQEQLFCVHRNGTCESTIERVVGSPFDDFMVGDGTADLIGGYGNDAFFRPHGDETVEGGPGLDTCDGAPCDQAGEAPPRSAGPFVFLAEQRDDLGLVALGSDGDDVLAISVRGGVAYVRTGAAPLTPGVGCELDDSAGARVRCELPTELRYILGWGGEGNDQIELEGSGFPRDMTAMLDGGNGDDTLVGSDGQDILFAGRSGHDTLEGRGGDDALVSDSPDGDDMFAGPGNDQLVANAPCAGHLYEGGEGFDIGGFAHVGNFDTAAERAHQRIIAQLDHRAYQPSFCAEADGTQLSHIEILEGAGGDDILTGNDGPNTIWGRAGDDEIHGREGNDVLAGLDGSDRIYGEAGQDRIEGGAGFDHLFAGDEGHTRDFVIDCGGDGGRVEARDPNDPDGHNCN